MRKGDGRRAFIVFALGLSLFAGCSDTKESEGISISVMPSDNALIGLGPHPSCLDRTNYLRSGAGSGATLSRSISGITVGFNNFNLTWEKPEKLYVQAIRVTVSGSGIENGSYTFSLPAIEIENLIAKSEGIIEPQFDPIDPNKLIPTVINSTDSARENVAPVYSRCGLRVGQIPLVDGEKDTSPFSANVEVELIGTSENNEGQQRFVRARAYARAKYFGS